MPSSLEAIELICNQLERDPSKKDSLELFQAHLSAGKAYISNKHLPNAISHFTEAINVLAKQKFKDHVALQAETYRHLGRSLMELMRLEEAKKALQTALDLRLTLKDNKPSAELSYYYSNLGRVCSLLGDHQEALKYYEYSRDLRVSITSKNTPCPLIASAWNSIGRVQSDLGKHEEALESYEIALKIRQQLYPTGVHSSVANTLTNVGRALLDLKEPHEALQKYEEAVTIRRKIYKDKDHIAIGNALMGMSRAYAGMKEYEMAIECFDEPLKITMALVGFHRNNSISRLLYALSFILFAKGEEIEAMNMYDYSQQIISYAGSRISLPRPSFWPKNPITIPPFDQSRFKEITNNISQKCHTSFRQTAVEMLKWYLPLKRTSLANQLHLKA